MDASDATKITLKERLHAVRERIDAAARRSGRSGGDIVLIAVTKHASMDQIRELITLGHMDFGENRVPNLMQRAAQVQEFLARYHDIARDRSSEVPRKVRWHMIGHLQRNKVKKLLPVVRLIHSVDSLRLAEELQAAANRHPEPVECLVQVNVAGASEKHGIAPAAARHLVDQMETMMNLRIRGIMAMAPLIDDPQQSKPYFELGREIFEDVRKVTEHEHFDILSMGMSSDFEVAIECGANVVRVGTAIFGEGDHSEEDEVEPEE